MVSLGRIEGSGGGDLGDDRIGEGLGLLERRPRLLRRLPLYFVVVKDSAAVLLADVAELSVGRRRIDVPPEDCEQLLIADDAWVKDDPYRFGVPCLSG